jgi:hypothetical protein
MNPGAAAFLAKKNRPPWMAVENLLAVLLYPPNRFSK